MDLEELIMKWLFWLITLFCVVVVGVWAYKNPSTAYSIGVGLYAAGKDVINYSVTKAQGLNLSWLPK